MSLRKSAACFSLHPIRTAYPNYPDLSLFNHSNSSKDWPRVQKIELFIIHFFSSFCYMLCCKPTFFPLSEAYSKPKLMETSVLFIHAFRNLQKRNNMSRKYPKCFRTTTRKNRGRNSPAFESIAMEKQGCLEVMLQSNVVKFIVTSYMFL